MVWPIPPLLTTRTNSTPQFDTHPADHNALADGVNELGARVAALPSPASIPRGRVGADFVIATQSGFGTTPTPTSHTLTYAFDIARYVEVALSIPIRIASGAATATAAILMSTYGTLVTGNLQLPSNGSTGWLHLRYQGKIASGSKTLTVTLAAVTGTVDHAGAVATPSTLTIVDLGI